MEEGRSNSILLSIGAGLDIGLFEYLTITPFVRLVYGLKHDWEWLAEENNESLTRDVMTGLHLVYRLDYKKRRF
jgi:hypothetical protein